MKINGNDIRLNEPYETRDGRVAIITRIQKSIKFQLRGYFYAKKDNSDNNDSGSWNQDGYYDDQKGHPLDIINLDKYNEPMKPETRPHKHAYLIAKLAEKLKTDHQAWRKVQYNLENEWYESLAMPSFSENAEYRFAPETVTINGVECPKAVSEPLKEGQQYFIPSFDDYDNYEECIWNNGNKDKRLLEAKLIHLTPEDAITVAKALMKPLTELK